ncbi:MAG: hypothetical protein GZ091_14170 [Paludibacter sp.]|nr:hypothetical protein [Paludibacter sp.]
MTLKEFLDEFTFINTGEYIDNNYFLIITKVIKNSNGKEIDSIETKLEINNVSKFIKETNSPVSITPYNWEMIVDITKRGQIDFFAQIVPIEDFYPRNSQTDISFVK